jgi:hypothetical protein
MITLTLPMPPSVNNLHIGTGKNCRRHPTYEAWIQEAGWRIVEARAQWATKALPADAWYWTDIRLPHTHLGDSDNRIKALHDLLWTMQVTPDDKWLLGGTYMRAHDVEPGTCTVTATSFGKQQIQAMEQVRILAQRVLSLPLGEKVA